MNLTFRTGAGCCCPGRKPGGATSRVKKIAADRDDLVIEARRSEAETAAALAAPMPVAETAANVFADTDDARDL